MAGAPPVNGNAVPGYSAASRRVQCGAAKPRSPASHTFLIQITCTSPLLVGCDDDDRQNDLETYIYIYIYIYFP